MWHPHFVFLLSSDVFTASGFFDVSSDRFDPHDNRRKPTISGFIRLGAEFCLDNSPMNPLADISNNW